MAETGKARARRLREKWFSRFAPDHMSGIDIGCGIDPLNHTFRQWDKLEGDAQKMEGLPDGIFHTVYASHILEHLHDPTEAIRNWWRILRPGGHLIILVPHRDMYEKRTRLPSFWNPDHKTYWLPSVSDPPDTLNFRDVIYQALGMTSAHDGAASLESFSVLSEGFNSNGPDEHSAGEYSIEAVLHKHNGQANLSL